MSKQLPYEFMSSSVSYFPIIMHNPQGFCEDYDSFLQ